MLACISSTISQGIKGSCNSRKNNFKEPPMVVYMSSSFWLLAVGSHDLSRAEKEITTCKADQILKITITVKLGNKERFDCY